MRCRRTARDMCWGRRPPVWFAFWRTEATADEVGYLHDQYVERVALAHGDGFCPSTESYCTKSEYICVFLYSILSVIFCEETSSFDGKLKFLKKR